MRCNQTGRTCDGTLAATKHYLTAGESDSHQLALGGLDLTEDVAESLIRDPAGLLGVIRLRLIDTLLFEGDEQPFRWIGIVSDLLFNLWHIGELSKKVKKVRDGAN